MAGRGPRIACAALAAALLVPAMPAAAAEIYRWVDADGVTQFGQRPVANAQRVDLPASSFRAAETGMLDAWEESLRENRAARLEKQAAQQKAAAATAARSHQCSEARRYRERLQNANRLFRVNAAGERERVDESVRTADLERINATISETCS